MITAQYIFDESIGFMEKALAVYRYQAVHCAVYREFNRLLGKNPEQVKELTDIPFLPVSFFKTHEVKCGDFTPEAIYTSSGTAGAASSHFVKDVSLYIESFSRSFRMFYGDIQRYCFLALLPSYLERSGSSLVAMCDDLIKKSGHPLSGFYLYNMEALQRHLLELKKSNQPVILIGVTYALLDLATQYPVDFNSLIVMETGGMKGKRKEMVREEVHQLLKPAFNIPTVHSEYGMTELLSQAWSKGNGLYFCPHWMRILAGNINDPLEVKTSGSGAINIIDLANINSCSFIATQDLGTVNTDGSFMVNGRFDHSDLRGCNLMVE